MKPENKIKKLFGKAAVDTNPKTDKKVLNKILAAQTESHFFQKAVRSPFLKIAAGIAIALIVAQALTNRNDSKNVHFDEIIQQPLVERNDVTKYNIPTDPYYKQNEPQKPANEIPGSQVSYYEGSNPLNEAAQNKLKVPPVHAQPVTQMYGPSLFKTDPNIKIESNREDNATASNVPSTTEEAAVRANTPPVTSQIQSLIVEPQVNADQIIWWGSRDDRIVAVWPDGTAVCWNSDTGACIIDLKIDNFWYEAPNSYMDLFLPPDIPVLVVSDPTTQEVIKSLAHGYRLYDLDTGKLNGFLQSEGFHYRRGRIHNYSTLSIQGLSSDGKSLLGSSALDRTLFQIDIESGKNLWYCHDEGIAIGSQNVLISPDVSQFLICAPDCITAKDRSGKVLWKHSFKEKAIRANRFKVIEKNNEIIYVVVKVIRTDRATKNIYIAFDGKGNLLWETEKKILDISSDGMHQAFAAPNGVEIGSLPSENTVALSGLTGPVEAQFTSDCSKVVCLPALQPNPEKKDSPYIEIMERPSNLSTFFDVNTGIKVNEIELLKQASFSEIKKNDLNPVSQQVKGMQCVISTNPSEVQVGQAFTIDIDIRNVSSSDITFYYEYLYKARKLVIKNEEGQVVSFSETAEYNWPHPKEFYQQIKAGQSYKQQITGRIAYALNQNAAGEEKAKRPLIIDFFDIAQHIDKPGTFTAALQLSADANTVKNGTSFGFSNIWTGKLVSNEIKFTVKPADRSFQDKMIEQLQSDELEQVNTALKTIQASADSKAIEKLMKMLTEGKQPLREVSQALIHIQDRKILPQLMNLYKNLSKNIINDQDQRQAEVLLTIKGLEPDRKKLEAFYMQIINSDDSVAAQQSAISELAMGNNPDAISVLIQVAKNENRYIHLSAIDSLGLLGSHLEEKNKQPIIDCLIEIMRTSPISEKRQRAVQALSHLGTESVIPFMIEALKDSDFYVGVSALFYLRTHGGLDAIESIEQYEKHAATDRQKSVAQDAIKTIRQRKSTGL